ncbi:hypothetical protein [Haladaptatus sp. DYF46]|uniref:hypothetical protein n=1 Tax=Haladaptatus sp. DYF46 TaxID=2886041 RepID=UPI001E5663D0|nr:hypothetical protein [Haladaptatus sp. DYF46]
MKRRRLLAVGGAALSGECLGRAALDVGGSESPETFGPDEVQRRMSLAGVDEVPKKYGVRIDVELLNGAVTAADTAHLRVTVTNEGEKRRFSAGEGMCNPFNRDEGKSETSGLWLHEPKDTKWIERKGDRWTRDRDQNERRAFANYACLPRTYEAGESLATEYLVWDDYQVGGYMDPGTYRFEVPIAIHPSGSKFGDPTAEFDWGFDLRVDDG